MGASEQRAKSAKMASDMVKKGIWHGRRMTSPRHANYPNPGEVGSTKYQRLMQTARGRASVADPVKKAQPKKVQRPVRGKKR